MQFFLRLFDRLIPPAPELPAEMRPPQMPPQVPHPAQAGLLAALLYLR